MLRAPKAPPLSQPPLYDYFGGVYPPELRFFSPEPPRSLSQEPFQRYEPNIPGTNLGDPLQDDWTPPELQQIMMIMRGLQGR